MKTIKKAICIAAVLTVMLALVACGDIGLSALLVRGEQVEAESDWVKAFDYKGVTNVTVVQTYSSVDDDDDDSEKGRCIYEFDGYKVHVLYEHTVRDGDDDPVTETEEAYWFLDTEDKYRYYMFDSDAGEWKSVSFNGDFPSAHDLISSLLSSYKSSRSSFEYSEYHKGYVKKSSDGEEDKDITIIKIKDGRVVVVQKSARDEDGKSSSYLWIHATDDTSVNIPSDIPDKPTDKKPSDDKE